MNKRGRVLIVDDEENVAITLQAVLQKEGYQTDKALSLDEARQLIEHHQYDAALADLRIGDAENGLELLQDLGERQPECMAIMLTGFASLESAIGAIRQGAYDYLIKPCDLEELKLTVARAVEHGAIARVLRGHLGEIEASNKELRMLADDLRQRLEETLSELHQRIAEASRQLSGSTE